MPAVGDAVWELVRGNDGVERRPVGVVERLHFKTWGRRRGALHSLTASHRIELRARSLRLVLVRSAGRWRNRLHAAAEYEVERRAFTC